MADILKATPAAERRGLIVQRVREHASRVLGTGADQLDVDRSLSEMGLDSLMAVELAEAVERDVAQPMSVMQMLSAGTISAIGDLVLKTLGLAVEGETKISSSNPGSSVDGVNGKAQLHQEPIVQAKS